MQRRTFLLGASAFATSACASAPAPGTTAGSSVGRYTSSPWSFSTASYWIEGPGGVVVIDTQFLASEARAVIDAARRATGKQVVAAVVLHANPDKFNGTATFTRHGARVLTSASVRDQIPAVHAQRLAAFGERYAPDFPLAPAQPEVFGHATTTLELAGLSLRAHVLGPGCGRSHVALQWRDHVFVGDLVASGAHAWMELGLLDEWLTRLDELEAMAPAHVHPGRGPSGGPELIAMQRAYLRDVSERVQRVAKAGPPGEHAARQLVAEITAAYPTHRFPVFLEVAMPALLRRATDTARRGAA